MTFPFIENLIGPIVGQQ